MLYQFAQLPRPILFRVAEPALESLRLALRGWDISEWKGEPADPVISVRKTLRGWGVKSIWDPDLETYTDEGEFVCDVVSELARSVHWSRPEHLCMHCAAVEMNGGVVIFPSTYRAGKSVLTAHLAQAGYRVFSDDVVPVHSKTGLAMSSGFLPRLRSPLPENASDAFVRYVRKNTVIAGKKYHYIDPGDALMTRLGDEAPIIGVVLLERSDTPIKARLTPQSRGAALRYAIQRNFGKNIFGEDLVQSFIRAVGSLPAQQIEYYRTEDAVALLTDHFG